MQQVGIVMPETAANFVAQVSLQGLIDACAKLDKADARQQPDTYAKAFARVQAAVFACAAMWTDEPPQPAGFTLPHTAEEQRLMAEGGLDPMKELGPHDPRASRPRCVHGALFTEECSMCAGPFPQQPSAAALDDSAGAGG